MKPCSGRGCWMTEDIMSRPSRYCQEKILHLFLIRPISWNINYRIGRIYDALGRKNEALEAYQTALKLGVNRT